MDVAVAVLIQAVYWPLAVVLAWRAAVRAVPVLPGAAVTAMLAAGAVFAWDPASQALSSRIAVAVVNASLALLLAIYPDGHLTPRWILIPAAVEIGLQLGNLASGLGWEDQPWWPAHFVVTWGVLLVGGQLHRYVRRSSIDERERTRWPLLGLVTMVLAFTLWTIVAAAGVAPDATWFANLLIAIPAPMFALGLIAPRLLRIDRILRLVVRWGLWAVAVAAVAWAVALLTAVLDPMAGAWITAAVTAIVALPAASGTRHVADLVVYGRRADPLRTLDELGGRLEASVDPRHVPDEIVSTVAHALGLSGAALHGGPALEATSGDMTSGAPTGVAEFPIRYQGELLATLAVRPRPGDSQLTAHDRTVIEQVCRQAAPALHGARVLGELIDARLRVVRAREEERKRLRRDLHDELAPTFAGLGLSAAAVEALTRAGDERATDAAAALVTGLHAATRQLRDVAYDLRPPVLDDRGLVAAIEDRVVNADAIPVVRLDAPPERIELPAAVELAALRIVQEAVMNVRRHAAATECVVAVRLGADDLEVTVVDDGHGLPAQRHDGVGLRSMRERAEEVGGTLRLRRRRGPGTIVEAVLPVRIRTPVAGVSGHPSRATS